MRRGEGKEAIRLVSLSEWWPAETLLVFVLSDAPDRGWG